MPGHEVLYVHPYGHLNNLVVPAGALTTLNMTRAPKLGRYAFEVEDAEIRAARIVAMDVHWALALTGFIPMVEHVRRVNPDAAIVVGGVTAGHYAREILETYAVDYVVQGDSEKSFAVLVDRLLEGKSTEGIPNVHQRDVQTVFVRMTEEEFSETDCITADWFPTYSRVSNWDAVAFPQGRTITVTRGCVFRCPECYGSFAETYGAGYLMRSPESVVKMLRHAHELQLRNVRLYVAKPPAQRFAKLAQAIGEAGPFKFSSAVGVYVCTPPTDQDIGYLEAGFGGEVAFSMVPPNEHVPRLKPAVLEKERQGWRQAAAYARDSDHVTLDAWTTVRGRYEDVAELLETETQPDEKVRVSRGTVWSVTRPVDGKQKHSFPYVREALQGVWSFYLGRLFSPALEAVLAPFAFLDELEIEPETLPVPQDARLPFYQEALANWVQHRLPTIPSLQFLIVPVEAQKPLAPEFGQVTLSGRLRRVRLEAEVTHDMAQPLRAEHDAHSIRFAGRVECPAGSEQLLIVPWKEGSAPWNEHLKTFASLGLSAVQLPPEGSERARVLQVDLLLQAQDAWVFVATQEGEVVAKGRSDQGYFNRKPRRRSF